MNHPHTAHIEPDPQTLQRFEQGGDDQPILMLNLLRLRQSAQYEDGEPAVSGQRAYARYSKHVLPLLHEVGGRIVLHARGRFALIAPPGESWDVLLVARYPSRQAFLRMIHSEAYQAIVHHRMAALADSRLIEFTPSRLPRLILAAMALVTRLRGRFSPRVT